MKSKVYEGICSVSHCIDSKNQWKLDMHHVIIIIGVVLFILSGSMVLAASEVSFRPEVQESIRQLEMNNSCPGCDLSGAILHRMNLAGANLEGANLAGAQLNLADMAGANLRNANLQGASFGGVDMAGADMTGANLTGAVIEGAYLAGAKMDGEVVLQGPNTNEGEAETGEKVFKEDEGKSKHLPFTNQAIIAEKRPATENSSQTVTDQPIIGAVKKSENKMQNRSKPADPLPKKSKQLSMLDEAVVAQNEEPQQRAIPVSGGSDNMSLKGKPIRGSNEVEVAAVELEEVLEEVDTAEMVESAPVIEEEIPLAEEKKQAEPVAEDPEVERKKLLVEKLLDDNRCVACDLSGVDLSGEDLEEADLERANLQGANLKEIDLEEANLKGANLRDTDLRHADMREADLYRADLSGADLTGVKFDGALIDSIITNDVIGADFEGAVGNKLSSPFLKK